MIATLVGATVSAVAVGCALSVVLFLLVAFIVRVRVLDATARQILWSVALWTTALIPFIALGTGVLRADHLPRTLRYATAGSAVEATITPTRSAAPQWTAVKLSGSTASFAPVWQPQLERNVALGLLALWLCGVIVGGAGLLRGLVRVNGLKRRSSPLAPELAAELPWLTQNGAHQREIYLRLSYETETPIAIGFRRPVILIPTELALQGGLAAIEGLIIHEHAHLRHRDDWTNLAVRIIERIFWFNPLVWVFGRRIALEREIAADDAVVAATGRPHEYAQSLWQIAREMRMPDHTVVAPGAFATRKQISVRIEAILERHPVAPSWRALVTGAVVLAAVASGVAAAATAPNLDLPAGGIGIVGFVWPAAQSMRPTQRPILRASVAPIKLLRRDRERPTITADRRKTRLLKNVSMNSVSEPTARPLERAARAGLTAAHDRVAELQAFSAEQSAPADPLTPPAPATPLIDCTGCKAEASSGKSDLSGADLRNVDWRGRTIFKTDLSGADLRGAQLDRTRFIESDLSGANLAGAALRNALFSATSIDGANLRHALTTGMQIVGESLSGADLRDLDIRSLLSACNGCDVSGADLRHADLHGLQLSGTNFSGANLRGVNFSGAKLVGVNFDGADLANAKFAAASAIGCSFDGANVTRAAFSDAHVSPPLPDESVQ